MHRRKKILILSVTRMGDIIQSVPFVQRLRAQHDDCELHVLVENCFVEVVGFWPGVHKLHVVRLEDLLPPLAAGGETDVARATKTYWDLIRQLQDERFDEVWNLTHTRPSTVLCHLLAGEHGCGVTLDAEGLQRVNSRWLTYFFATNLARPWCQFNLVDIYANCVNGAPWNLHRSLSLERASYSSELQSVPPRMKTHRIALHVGASQAKKQWPAESFRRVAETLIQQHDIEIVLIGGARDAKLAESFANLGKVNNCIGSTNVRQLAALLSQCDLLISSDSGPMHVAAGVGTKVLDITLGSALGSETAPYGEGHLVVEPDSACFPCAVRDQCTQASCAERITPDTVVALAEWQLGLRRTVAPDDVAGTRVYRTGFSKTDGLLELERLFAHDPLLRDQLNQILRPFWLHVLADRPLPPMECARMDTPLRTAAHEARIIACMARNTARQMARAAHKPEVNQTTIENLGQLLRQQEARLRQRLSGSSILNSLQMYSNLRRGSLQGSTVTDQARETAEIYAELQQLLSAFCLAEPSVANKQHSYITQESIS